MTQQTTNNKVEKNQIKEQTEKAESVKFPRFSLLKTLKIAESIEKNNAGKPYDRLDLAKSLDASPASSAFRMLITTSSRYGLTEGNYNADKISLTTLGSSIVSPTSDEEKINALRQALLSTELYQQVFTYYDKKQIPREELLKNTLKKEFRVDPSDVDFCYQTIMENMQELGLSQDIKGSQYLQLDKLGKNTVSTPDESTVPENELFEHKVSDVLPSSKETESKPVIKQIFVAHGKNTKPLEQLKAILTQFKIPFQVAIDEPHAGRPISGKVAELMRQCTSGIFIFTADEETTDSQGNKLLRPSDNVVFELGAGTILYGNKIVVFREEGVSFGSDFTDYGRISFDKDKLDAKSFDLMKELISLGFLSVSPT